MFSIISLSTVSLLMLGLQIGLTQDSPEWEKKSDKMKDMKVLFSPVTGRIMKNGKPVSNLEITQTYIWLGIEDGVRKTLTDKDGYYSFPDAVTIREDTSGSSDIFIFQNIIAEYAGDRITLWETTKYNFLFHGELGGTPIHLSHELSDESQNYMIPTYNNMMTNLDGVVKPQHDYLIALELGASLLLEKKKEIEFQLLDIINSEEVMVNLNRQFVFAPFQTDSLLSALKVKNVEFSFPAIYSSPNCDSASLKSNSYYGFSIKCWVLFFTKNEESTEFELYWPKASFNLFEPTLRLERNNKHRISIHSKTFIQQKLEARINGKSLTQSILDYFYMMPNEELAYAFDPKLSIEDRVYESKTLPGNYQNGYSLEKIKLHSISVGSIDSQENCFRVSCIGNLTPTNHDLSYDFSAHFCLSLSSFVKGKYELIETENCSLYIRVRDFDIKLNMVQPVFSEHDPITLEFEVLNLLPKTNVFLKWHTPFEGFMNNFLLIKHLESSVEIPYSGMLKKRAAPTRENGAYIEFGIGETKTVTINIRDAYDITEKGDYQIFFKQLGTFDDENAPFALFTID